MPGAEEFTGEIVVASRIVDYLSSGLYESPAASLKELINNSYDADANRVDVFVKPDADRIIIEDDGTGMDRGEFIKHFSRISESHKRAVSEYTPSGRPKIGKIGIGFIAANEICDVMEIVSTKPGRNQLLQVEINFDLMRQAPDLRQRGDTDLAKAHYRGRVGEAEPRRHFTQVFLKKVRGEARSILAGAGSTPYASGEKSLYGLKPESVCQELKDDKLRSWSEFDAYSKNRLEIALNVPVRYHENWLPSHLREEVLDFEKHVADLSFAVFLDGSELRKPTVFNPDGEALISRFDFQGEHVAARGYFYAQHGAIRPQELQGVLLRIRNAALGGYDSSFLGFNPSIGPLFQTWISGEIWADDRLEDAMNIDRRTLRSAHPAYVELQDALHKHLAKLISRVRTEIYGSKSRARAKQRAERVEQDIVEVSSDEVARRAPSAAEEMRGSWADAASDEKLRKKVLRKFTVAEVYGLVTAAAEGVLSEEELERLLERLTDQLLR